MQDSLVTLAIGDDAAATRILDEYPVSVGVPYDTRRRAEYQLQPGEKLTAGAVPAFPSTRILDDFNRPDEDPITTNWTTPLTSGDQSARCVGYRFAGAAAGGWGTAYYDLAQFGPDCEAYITVTTLASAATVWARATSVGGSTSGYAVLLSSTTIYIYRVDAAVGTIIAQKSLSSSAGCKIGIRAIGSQIEAWRDVGSGWVRQLVVTDSTYATKGYIATEISGSTGRSDNFGGGDVGSIATPKVRDNFNRANNATVGTGWTEGVHGSTTRAEIVNNAYSTTGTGAGSISCFTQDGSFMRGFVKARVSQFTAHGDNLGVGWTKASDTTHGYHVEFQNQDPSGDLVVNVYLDNSTSIGGDQQFGARPLIVGDEIGMYLEDIGDRANIEVWHKMLGSQWKRLYFISTNTTTQYQAGPYYPALRAKYSDEALDDFGYAIARGSPFIPILDTFNRADGGLGANWTTPAFGWSPTALTISSNMITSSSSASWQYWNPTVFGPDCAAECRVMVKPTGTNRVYLYLRTDVAGSSPGGYFFRYGADGNMIIGKSSGGSETTLVSTSITAANLDVMRFEAQGPVLRAYVNDNLILATTDTVFTGPGRAAIYIDDTTTRVDNFGAADGNVFGYPMLHVEGILEDQ